MSGYALVLLGQTALALLALGLAGGWVLWAFRRDDRPYLWLAAPLAGLPTLGFALTVLNYLCAVPVMTALAVSFPLLCLPTLVRLYRWLRSSGAGLDWRAVVIACTAVVGGATTVCNLTAIKRGEPTISVTFGSDSWGYIMTSNWLKEHPGENPVLQPDRLNQAFLYYMLVLTGDRQTAYLLPGIAGHLRGTTATFSFDWLCGVVLAAAVLGLAGLYSRNRQGLVLLALAGALCAWFPLTRTGYFAKLLSYPSCLLLCFAFFSTWERPSKGRVALACLLGVAVGLCLNPITALAVLVMFAGGAAFVHLALRGGSVPVGGDTVRRHCRMGIALALAMTVPLEVFHLIRYQTLGTASYPIDWQRIVPVSLDLDTFILPLVETRLAWKLVAAAVLLVVVLLAVAHRRGEVEAQALLLCVGLIPVAWLLGNKQLFAFQGILFPMTAAGAALLLGRGDERRPSRAARWAVAVVALGLVAVRLPGGVATGKLLLDVGAPYQTCFTQSEVRAMRDAVGGRVVDVCCADVHNVCLVWTELDWEAGLPMQYHEPTWTRLFGYTKWKAPVHDRKAALTLTECPTWHSGRTLFKNRHLALIEDGGDVALKGYQVPHTLQWDGERRPLFFVGKEPARLKLCNGGTQPRRVTFRAGAGVGPHGPGTDRRTLHWSLSQRSGEQILTSQTAFRIEIVLDIPPGEHWLSLSCPDPMPEPPAGPDTRDLLLVVLSMSLEESPPSPEETPPILSSRESQEEK